MITSIETFQKDENKVFVRAVIEDMVLLYPQSHIDPPEYGSALCEVSFKLDEDEILPQNEKELIDYLDFLDLDWKVLTDDWDY